MTYLSKEAYQEVTDAIKEATRKLTALQSQLDNAKMLHTRIDVHAFVNNLGDVRNYTYDVEGRLNREYGKSL